MHCCSPHSHVLPQTIFPGMFGWLASVVYMVPWVPLQRFPIALRVIESKEPVQIFSVRLASYFREEVTQSLPLTSTPWLQLPAMLVIQNVIVAHSVFAIFFAGFEIIPQLDVARNFDQHLFTFFWHLGMTVGTTPLPLQGPLSPKTASGVHHITKTAPWLISTCIRGATGQSMS